MKGLLVSKRFCPALPLPPLLSLKSVHIFPPWPYFFLWSEGRLKRFLRQMGQDFYVFPAGDSLVARKKRQHFWFTAFSVESCHSGPFFLALLIKGAHFLVGSSYTPRQGHPPSLLPCPLSTKNVPLPVGFFSSYYLALRGFSGIFYPSLEPQRHPQIEICHCHIPLPSCTPPLRVLDKKFWFPVLPSWRVDFGGYAGFLRLRLPLSLLWEWGVEHRFFFSGSAPSGE